MSIRNPKRTKELLTEKLENLVTYNPTLTEALLNVTSWKAQANAELERRTSDFIKRLETDELLAISKGEANIVDMLYTILEEKNQH